MEAGKESALQYGEGGNITLAGPYIETGIDYIPTISISEPLPDPILERLSRLESLIIGQHYDLLTQLIGREQILITRLNEILTILETPWYKRLWLWVRHWFS